MAKKPASKKVRHRSAVSGKYVKPSKAMADPERHVSEKVKKK